MPTSRPVDQTDLKEVRGIGRKVEAHLKEAGIMDLGQLARTPVNELAAILAGLPGRYDADRIIREDWLGQAAVLTANSPTQAETVETMAPVRYNFTVEVRRSVTGGKIDSSRIVHVQTRDEEAWHGWNPERLVAFIEERSGMRPMARSERPEAQVLPRPATAAAAGQRSPHSMAKPSLHTFAMVPGSGPDITMRGSIKATLTFDPTAVQLPADQAVEVRTDVFVRQRAPSKSILVGRGGMPVRAAEPVRLEIPCQLPVMSRPTAMFATVRVLVTAANAGRPPTRGLAGACLEISA
jgi:hypothetical protein